MPQEKFKTTPQTQAALIDYFDFIERFDEDDSGIEITIDPICRTVTITILDMNDSDMADLKETLEKVA